MFDDIEFVLAYVHNPIDFGYEASYSLAVEQDKEAADGLLASILESTHG